jgi:pseudomonalisin/xanthomonalisin
VSVAQEEADAKSRERGAQNLGPLKARTMTITFALAPRNGAALKAFVGHAHGALTSSQFNSRYAPTQTTVATIRSWAQSEGLTVQSVSADRLLVLLRGRSTAIGRALDTSFDSFKSSTSGQFFALTRTASLPKAIAPKLTAVLGLSSLSKLAVPQPVQRSTAGLNKVLASAKSLLPSFGLAAPTLEYPGQYDPQDFWSMYDAPSTATGSGQQLAIIAEGNVSQPQKDLVTFEQKFGLPAVTWHQINVGTASSDTSGDDEWDLDSQYSTGFAPG